MHLGIQAKQANCYNQDFIGLRLVCDGNMYVKTLLACISGRRGTRQQNKTKLYQNDFLLSFYSLDLDCNGSVNLSDRG